MDFLGLYNHSLDAKNRIFIPSKYREYLGDTFVVCKAPDTCLYIYSQEEWEKVAAQVKALPGTPEFRRYKRSFFEAADIVEEISALKFVKAVSLSEIDNIDQDFVGNLAHF